VDKAVGYGIEGVQIDGNNILEVYETLKEAREFCIKNQKPYLIECMTFRMRGHEEASGVKYVPKHLFDMWEQKDPIKNYEAWLKEENILSEGEIEEIRANTKSHIESELAIGFNSEHLLPNTVEEVNDVYAPRINRAQTIIDNSSTHDVIFNGTQSDKKFINAISDAIEQSLQRFDDFVVMGQDIAEYGGAFKVTEGFVEKFGKERIRNTPICESAIVGTALGLSLHGMKSMMEMQFADFATVGFNQIINNLAKIHYRWGQPADVVVRMPTGGGVGAGPFHSQSNEAWFVHTPGLKVVYPSSPIDAKGLLVAAINDPNPVLFFEHKGLYRSVSGMVPDDYYEIEIGKAKHVKAGTDISIITYGAGVHWALDYQKNNTHISLDILDLRTLLPLDYDAIKASVMRTGKVLILHEDSLIGGIGGEISAWINEHCFMSLDAPILRCASLDTPIPFNLDLEKNFMAYSRLGETVERLMKY
jgi:2-oxoisovalerate dehydrogenase E1 component